MLQCDPTLVMMVKISNLLFCMIIRGHTCALKSYNKLFLIFSVMYSTKAKGLRIQVVRFMALCQPDPHMLMLTMNATHDIVRCVNILKHYRYGELFMLVSSY